jgi:asparagine synthase (glutamine-hydrolysing)
MKSTIPLKSEFLDLSKGDFSSLSGCSLYEMDGTKLFLNGRFYDTEPIEVLKKYKSAGVDMLKKIDGDFVLIIIDDESINVVRDRHGVGSQIFFTNNYFTSNLLEFTKLEGFECKPNIEALMTFLSIGYIPSPLCSLDGVTKLGSGNMLTLKNGKITVTDLFPASDYMKNVSTCKLTIDDATEEYERLHKKAIKNRIGKETKIGLLLSGGYDSGGNISALRDVYDGEISSFSIGFKNNQWTELPLAKILSERYKSSHHDYEIEGSEIMNLPKIISVTGDPFQEGGLMVNYTAMELVKNSGEKPDLILGGDGNDQHFGTSGKELALHWKMKQNGGQIIQKIFDYTGNLSLFENDNILFRSEFQNRKILHIQQCDVFGFTQYQVNKINSIGFKMGEFSYLKNHPKKFNNFDEFFFNRNLNIDIKQVINEVILYKSSRMGELFKNNISFPYMSTDLYDFLNTLPVDYKFHGTLDELSKGKGVSKYLHKKYLKPKLPTEITDRKKQGGFAPLPIFLKDNKQRNELFTFLRKSDMVKQLFDYNAIDKLFKQYDESVNSSYWFWFQQVKANQIINLLTLAVWWEMFINKKTNIQSITELL